MEKVLIKIFVFIISVYQSVIKYIDADGRRTICIFYPSCSEYTKEAIFTYGLLQGTKLSFFRILRCHPKGNFSYDPLSKEKEILV